MGQCWFSRLVPPCDIPSLPHGGTIASTWPLGVEPQKARLNGAMGNQIGGWQHCPRQELELDGL